MTPPLHDSPQNKVLSIPELSLSISQFLTPHELAQSILVSRSWSTIFTPILWETIDIKDNIQYYRFIRHSTLKALARHAHLIRTLRSRYCQLLQVFVDSTTAVDCSNLTHLEFPYSSRHGHPERPRELFDNCSGDEFENGKEKVEEVTPVVHKWTGSRNKQGGLQKVDPTFLALLLDKAPRLTTFAMNDFPFAREDWITTLAGRLSGLKVLRLSSLGFSLIKAQPIQNLFSHFHRHLEELEIGISLVSEFGMDEGPMGTGTLEDGPWALKKLSIRLNTGKGSKLKWLPMLGHCSALETLTVDLYREVSLENLSTMIRTHCLNLVDLTLRCMTGPQEDHAIAELISSSKKGWRRLSLMYFHGFGPLSAEALVKHAPGLESLVLSECDGFGSEEIQAILRSSPRLQTFQAMTSNSFHFSSTVYLDARDMVRAPWTCTFLRHLKVIITGIARPDLKVDQYGEPLTGPLHDGSLGEGYVLHKAVYKQLGALTHLQELWLGHDKQDLDDQENYHPTDAFDQYQFIDPDFQFECLEFSLRSGLDLLSGLKDLRVLNLDRVQVRMGMSEVQWMARHWPRLERIVGLVVQGEVVPKHVQWLYDHWPELELPPVMGNFTTTF